ncbi:MAG: NYN domain-containing protein [Erysipelotrichales bacterium]|nr:NYN domain-containing protein [Erysipelotrichales bacterium]
MDGFKSMAVLIDADNVSHKSINAILDELKSKGNIVIKRAYGSINKLKEWEDECVKNAINISSHFNNVKGKNVSDFNLIIEAMDILYTRNVDTFVIVSSDSDFTGLIARLKESNKKVIGVGKSDAPQSLKNACNDFIFIENLNKKGIETNLETIKDNITKLTKINKYILDIISSSDEPLVLSRIRDMIKAHHPDFDVRSYGSKNFSNFMKNVPGVTVKTLNDNTTMIAELKTSSKKDNNAPTLDELKEFVAKELSDSKEHNLSELRTKIKQEFPTLNIKTYASKFTKLLSMLDLNLEFTPKKKPVSVKIPH